MENDWAQILADAANNDYRINLTSGREMARKMSFELNEGLVWGANMVLQHYRHPPEVTLESLVAEE